MGSWPYQRHIRRHLHNWRVEMEAAEMMQVVKRYNPQSHGLIGSLVVYQKTVNVEQHISIFYLEMPTNLPKIA